MRTSPNRTDPLVLDTDVASDIIRDRLVGPMVNVVTGRRLYLTFVTVDELWRWAHGSGWGARSCRKLDDWIRAATYLPADVHVSETWGQITAAAKRRGRPRPFNDAWIAATCLTRDLPLITRNVKDFADFATHDGLRMVDT